MSRMPVKLLSCGTSCPKLTIWLWVTGTVAVQTFIPFSFCSQVSGVALQSTGGRPGGLQQSTTSWPAPHGTSAVTPAGTGNVDESKLYDFCGRSNGVSVTSESNRKQPLVAAANTNATIALRMVP